MRIITKAAISVFCAGVLIAGVGTGIAVAEYTSLEYTGKHNLSEEHMIKETIDLEIPSNQDEQIRIVEPYWRWNANVVYDTNVPENMIRYVIEYNPDLIQVKPLYEPEDKMVYLNTYYVDNDLDLFLRNKDYILEDLKNHKIGSYTMEHIKSIDILINPAMEEIIQVY